MKKVRYRKGGNKKMSEEVVQDLNPDLDAGVVDKPKNEPIVVGSLYIWPGVNSRGKYYTFSKRNSKEESGFSKLFVTEAEYKMLRGL